MLLLREYRFIVLNQDRIIKQARELYKIVTQNIDSKLVKRCLDFKKLEEVSKNYRQH